MEGADHGEWQMFLSMASRSAHLSDINRGDGGGVEERLRCRRKGVQHLDRPEGDPEKIGDPQRPSCFLFPQAPVALLATTEIDE